MRTFTVRGVFSEHSMKPSLLKWHLSGCHADLLDGDIEIFTQKEIVLKRVRLDKSGHVNKQTKQLFSLMHGCFEDRQRKIPSHNRREAYTIVLCPSLKLHSSKTNLWYWRRYWTEWRKIRRVENSSPGVTLFSFIPSLNALKNLSIVLFNPSITIYALYYTKLPTFQSKPCIPFSFQSRWPCNEFSCDESSMRRIFLRRIFKRWIFRIPLSNK